MNKLIALVVVSGLCFIAGLYLFNQVANSEAHRLQAESNLEYARGQARAMVIEAQGQASLDRAEAEAIRASAFTSKMLAMLPYTVLGVLGVLGLALVALSFVIVTKGQQNRPKVIERVIIERLPEPPPRRVLPQAEAWQLPALIIDDKVFSELED